MDAFHSPPTCLNLGTTLYNTCNASNLEPTDFERLLHVNWSACSCTDKSKVL